MELKNRSKAFGSHIDTSGLNLNDLGVQINESLHTKDYDWWYKVQPGDVVVDMGANVGMFSTRALDCGAGKLYMVEANRNFLKNAIKNCAEYLMNEPDVIVYPINCFLGLPSTTMEEHNIFTYNNEKQNLEDIECVSIRDLVECYSIPKIDFLKIDIEGGEYEIGLIEFKDWIYNNVKHIAMEVHFPQYNPTWWHRWVNFRDNFLMRYHLEGRLRLQVGVDSKKDIIDNIMQCNSFEKLRKLVSTNFFMLYLLSEDSPHRRQGFGELELKKLELFERAYTKDLMHRFSQVDIVKKNYSESFQDMFVLSMLDGKTDGSYVEIGAGRAFYGNNTALLEEKFNWHGVSFDINENFVKDHNTNRKHTCLHRDATTVDYCKLLPAMGLETEIDYLQIDCEPPEVSFQVLLTIPFDQYKFGVITFEHDHYADTDSGVRDKSRKYLESYGYKLVVNNIAPDEWRSYEDWWVHPDLVDKKLIDKFLLVNDNVKKAKDYMLGKLKIRGGDQK